MNKSSAKDQTPGGFKGGAGGSKGNPTPTAQSLPRSVRYLIRSVRHQNTWTAPGLVDVSVKEYHFLKPYCISRTEARKRGLLK